MMEQKNIESKCVMIMSEIALVLKKYDAKQIKQEKLSQTYHLTLREGSEDPMPVLAELKEDSHGVTLAMKMEFDLKKANTTEEVAHTICLEFNSRSMGKYILNSRVGLVQAKFFYNISSYCQDFQINYEQIQKLTGNFIKETIDFLKKFLKIDSTTESQEMLNCEKKKKERQKNDLLDKYQKYLDLVIFDDDKKDFLIGSSKINLQVQRTEVSKQQSAMARMQEKIKEYYHKRKTDMNKLFIHQRQILRKIRFIQEFQNSPNSIKKQKLDQTGSYGDIYKFRAPYYIFSASINRETNEMMEKESQSEERGYNWLIQKKSKCSQDKAENQTCLESFNLQVNTIKKIRALKCPQIASYFIKEIYFGEKVESLYSLYYSQNIMGDKSQEGKKRSKKFFEILIFLLDGLAFLSDNNILHRDLKPDNIKVERLENQEKGCSFVPKIIDFGSAYNLDQWSKNQAAKCKTTKNYNKVFGDLDPHIRSQLVFKQKKKYSQSKDQQYPLDKAIQHAKSSFYSHRHFDMHAFGVIARQLLNDYDIKRKYATKIGRMRWVINKCIMDDPDKRIGPIEASFMLYYISKLE